MKVTNVGIQVEEEYLLCAPSGQCDKILPIKSYMCVALAP